MGHPTTHQHDQRQKDDRHDHDRHQEKEVGIGGDKRGKQEKQKGQEKEQEISESSESSYSSYSEDGSYSSQWESESGKDSEEETTAKGGDEADDEEIELSGEKEEMKDEHHKEEPVFGTGIPSSVDGRCPDVILERERFRDAMELSESVMLRRTRRTAEVERRKKESGDMSRVVYIEDLPENLTQEDLAEVLSPLGEVESIRLAPRDTTRRYGFVMFQTVEKASLAAKALNAYQMQGKYLSAQQLKLKNIKADIFGAPDKVQKRMSPFRAARVRRELSGKRTRKDKSVVEDTKPRSLMDRIKGLFKH